MSSLIRSLDQTLSFQRLLWGVPLCLAVHNVEEARRVGEFVGLTRRINPWITLEERQFLALATSMTLAAVVLASRAAADDERSTTLLLWVQAGLFVNAFVPHLLLSVRLRRYTPGVATALLLNIPFTLYLFHRAFREGYLQLP